MVNYFPKERLKLNRKILGWLDQHYNKFQINDPAIPAPFFIIGSGRSGTTLLRTILNGHASIVIPPEIFGFRNGYMKYKFYQWKDWDHVSKIVINTYKNGKEFFLWDISLKPIYNKVECLPNENQTFARLIDLIFREYLEENKPTAQFWGDKTPLNTFYLEWIYQVFPNARYINLIRDGRDVVSSLKKAGLTNMENACLRWNMAIDHVSNFENKYGTAKVLHVYYEDLVSNPTKAIKKICEFLSIPFRDQMLDNSGITSNMNDIKYFEHFKNLLNPINEESIGKWKKNLSSTEIKMIMNQISINMKKLNYI